MSLVQDLFSALDGYECMMKYSNTIMQIFSHSTEAIDEFHRVGEIFVYK